MTAQDAVGSIVPSSSAAQERRRDWQLLALLILLIIPIRAWVLYRTEVPARDSIGYIRYALQFEQMSWPEVLERNHQHPGYAFATWLVSIPVRAALGDDDPYVMQLCAQLVSSLAAVLLVVPMFILGKSLWNRGVAFWGSFLFQVLPVSGHHLGDGVSEGLFLLLIACTLLFGVRALESGRTIAFAWCGFFAGLAYLTRPEGLLLAAATLLVLGIRQLTRAAAPWAQVVRGAVALGVALAATGSLYVLATGSITNKMSVRFIFGIEEMPMTRVDDAIEAMEPCVRAVGATVQADVFAAFIKPTPNTGLMLSRTFVALGAEITHSLNYVGVVPAVLGLAWNWSRLRRSPGFWLVSVACGIQAITLVALGMRAFYVSDRHILLLVMVGCFLMAAGLRELPIRLAALWARRRAVVPANLLRYASVVSIVLLTAMTACGLPRTLSPLHGNRRGNHEAGKWLAEQLREGDLVVDDHCWSHYYAGQVFLEGKEPELPVGKQPTCYVVMTRSRIAAVDEKRDHVEANLVRAGGAIVWHYPQNRSVDSARVVVYALKRDYAAYPWRIAQR